MTPDPVTLTHRERALIQLAYQAGQNDLSADIRAGVEGALSVEIGWLRGKLTHHPAPRIERPRKPPTGFVIHGSPLDHTRWATGGVAFDDEFEARATLVAFQTRNDPTP